MIKGKEDYLWKRLKYEMEKFEKKWYLGGDFNIVRNEEESMGSGNIDRTATSFNAFINDLGLIDLPLIGGKYKWSNYKEQTTFSRLDRFFNR